MNNAEQIIENYLNYCRFQKRLDAKTIKAYKIDLKQFKDFIGNIPIREITTQTLESYIATLHESYKPKTAKRKIASIKAFFHHLDYKELITANPFNKMQIHFRESISLPKTVPLRTIEVLLSKIYHEINYAKTPYQRRNGIRDAALIELLFATGIRVSELCSISPHNINLIDETLLINGKGKKERLLQIGNADVINTLRIYQTEYCNIINQSNHFFVSQNGNALSDQSVRRIINKYTTLAAIDLHITPHMFRHTFATSLLEADVDIRYIQEMLGHSSINITEIYTHVAMSKQKDILTNKHPRKNMHMF